MAPFKLGDLGPMFKVIWYIFRTTDPIMVKFEWDVFLKFGDLDPIFKIIWYIFRTTDSSMLKFE